MRYTEHEITQIALGLLCLLFFVTMIFGKAKEGTVTIDTAHIEYTFIPSE